MGFTLDDIKQNKHIENQDNKNENKIKNNSYEKIKDIVLGKNEKTVIEKNKTIKNKNNTIKNTIDIGL